MMLACTIENQCIKQGSDDFMKHDMSLDANLFGVATVGERGQIVIPAEARKKAGIHPGDKVLVAGHPAANGLMIFKMDALREFLTFLTEDFSKIESRFSEQPEEQQGESDSGSESQG